MKAEDVVAKLDARVEQKVEELTAGLLETIDQLTVRVRVLEEYVKFYQGSVFGTAQALQMMEAQMYGVNNGQDEQDLDGDTGSGSAIGN